MGFVDEPAIERGWMAFNSEPIGTTLKFKLGKEDEMVVTGPMMIPDKVILRKDPETKEYFLVSASRETIRECRKKFATLGLQSTSNVNHFDPSYGLCTMVEHWEIRDFDMDPAKALGFEELPAGTWMGSWQVRDQALWQRIKSGELTGFSIEGWFDMIESPAPQSIKAKSENLNLNMNTKPRPSFGKWAIMKLAALLGASGKLLMVDHTLKDGVTKIQIDDETGEVFILDAEGNRGDKAPDATHELDSGELLVVYGGLAVLTTTSHLAAATETAIQVLIAAGKTRDEVLADITAATELTDAEVSSILAGTFGCMVMDKRDLLATAIGLTADDLKAAAAMDGCTDEEVEDVEVTAEAKMRREAFEKGVKAAMKIQLSKDCKVIKLAKQAKVNSQAEMLEDGSLIYIMVDSGRVYNVGADLYIEDRTPAGTYTTIDGKTIVVVETEVIFDEGTEHEWSYTTSTVEYNASTLEPSDYMPWIGEVTEVAAQAVTEAKAAHSTAIAAMNTKMTAETKAKDEAVNELASAKAELQKVKAELAEVKNRPVVQKGTFTKVQVEVKAKPVSKAKEEFLAKYQRP